MHSSKIFYVLAVNVDRTRDLQILSLTLSQLSYPRNFVMSDLISELLIYVSVNIVLWCFSCLIEITTNYSSVLWCFHVYFTLGHQPYFEHITYQWPYFHINKFHFRFESWSELTGERIYVPFYVDLFSPCVIHKLNIRLQCIVVLE